MPAVSIIQFLILFIVLILFWLIVQQFFFCEL
jgi:hypothetical protein